MVTISLRTKILLILLGIFAVYALLNYGVQHYVIYPRFVLLEEEEAKRNMNRAIQALQREIHGLEWFCHDWSAWDDIYIYAQDRNEAFAETNLTPTLLADYKLDIVYIASATGDRIWSRDIRMTSEGYTPLEEFPTEGISVEHPIMSVLKAPGPYERVTVNGIIQTSAGPLLFASRPIVSSQHEGPPSGVLIMARFLDAVRIKTLEEQTQLKISIRHLADPNIPPQGKSALSRLKGTTSVPYLKASATRQYIFEVFPDYSNHPCLLIEVSFPRHITNQGRLATLFATVSLLIGGLIGLLVLMTLLHKAIVSPVIQLRDHMVRVGETDDLSAKLASDRDDEIGVLAREFDRMVGHLADARKKLLEHSYKVGKAEVAAEVLHNVRNSLSPISGAITFLRDRIRNTHFERIEAVKSELAQSSVDPQRAKDLNQYLVIFCDRVCAFLRESQGKLVEIDEDIVRIEQLLAQQDAESHISERPKERVQLGDIVQDAVAKTSFAIQEFLRYHLSVDDEARSQVIRTDRNALVQIIACLLSNASESVQKLSEG
ncbi:MAG TPA: CHASE4 domain-containing protein, partial [bacterium]|nr:CHASE4 domain-containing protein [bacterium]